MLVSPWRIIRSELECGMFSFGSLLSSNGWVCLVSEFLSRFSWRQVPFEQLL